METKTGMVAILGALAVKFALGALILLAVCLVLFMFSTKFRGWMRDKAEKRDVKVAAKQAEKAAKKAVK